jgi:hypothetical protein
MSFSALKSRLAEASTALDKTETEVVFLAKEAPAAVQILGEKLLGIVRPSADKTRVLCPPQLLFASSHRQRWRCCADPDNQSPLTHLTIHTVALYKVVVLNPIDEFGFNEWHGTTVAMSGATLQEQLHG